MTTQILGTALCAVLAFAMPVHSQVVESPPAPPTTEAIRQLKDLEERWARAFVNDDSASLGPLIHPRFIGVYPTRWSTRQDFMISAHQKAGPGERDLIRSLPDPDKDVRVFGSTAVVRGTARQEVEEGPLGSRTRNWVITVYTEVFIWENGRWQCISGHYTPVYSRGIDFSAPLKQ